jgi:hypothetical protein
MLDVASSNIIIIAARVVNRAANLRSDLPFNDVVKMVIDYDWSRENAFFEGKILSKDKNIMSSATSLKETADALFYELFQMHI